MTKLKLDDVTVDFYNMFQFSTDTLLVFVKILDAWAENLPTMVIQSKTENSVFKWVNQKDFEEDSRPSLYSVLEEVVKEMSNQEQCTYQLSL